MFVSQIKIAIDRLRRPYFKMSLFSREGLYIGTAHNPSNRHSEVLLSAKTTSLEGLERLESVVVKGVTIVKPNLFTKSTNRHNLSWNTVAVLQVYNPFLQEEAVTVSHCSFVSSELLNALEEKKFKERKFKERKDGKKLVIKFDSKVLVSFNTRRDVPEVYYRLNHPDPTNLLVILRQEQYLSQEELYNLDNGEY